MKAKSRELLVTTKVAKAWNASFDQRVDELIALVGRIDTEEGVLRTVELMDVYHNGVPPVDDAAPRRGRKRARRRAALPNPDRPFEFVVFRN